LAPVSVVILAAGQGKRMHSALPKVLQPLAGRPLLAHVVATARAIRPAAIHVVYGHGGEAVREAFAADADLKWALQAEQLGTGHAVMQAMPAIPDDHRVLVLCGDVPLIRPETLERLAGDGARSKLALLTARVDDATGYGRVLRNGRGEVTRIVEHNDATDDERRVNEINTALPTIVFEAKDDTGADLIAVKVTMDGEASARKRARSTLAVMPSIILSAMTRLVLASRRVDSSRLAAITMAVIRNTQCRPNEAAIAPPSKGPSELPRNIAEEVMP